jgi:hypothetical protein
MMMIPEATEFFRLVRIVSPDHGHIVEFYSGTAEMISLGPMDGRAWCQDDMGGSMVELYIVSQSVVFRSLI